MAKMVNFCYMFFTTIIIFFKRTGKITEDLVMTALNPPPESSCSNLY